MPDFKITLPDGASYKVTAPDEGTAYSALQTSLAGQPKAEAGRGGVLPSFAEGFATGFTDIPLGIAGLFTARPEETAAGKFSTGARDVIQDVLGIDPTKEATMAETGASALGSLGSFLVPGLGAAGIAKGVGMGARAASAVGSAAAGAQGAALGSGEQAQRAMAQEQATGQKVSDTTRQSAQLLGGAIGLSEILPLQRFLGPLEKILAKVPLSKAGPVSELIQIGVTGAIKSGTAEGAQEAISQLAQNLVEKGLYNPELDVTEGLLGNAAAGGFAGGTLDAILQLMAGRKIRKQTTSRAELGKQLRAESDEAAPERVRAEALDGVNTLRATAPAGTISVVTSQMPGEENPRYHIVDANKKSIASFSSADAAILAGKQYEADSGGVSKFEPPTITEMVKIKAPKGPKLSKAEKNKALQEAKRLKAQGALAPAPTVAPATTPEGQATTEASIEKVVAETPVMAPKKGRKPLAPTEAVVPPEAAPPVATAAEITLPETPTEAPPAAELTADERVAIWKGIAPQAQSFRDLTPDQQRVYFEALKAAKPVGVKPYTGPQPAASTAAAKAPAVAKTYGELAKKSRASQLAIGDFGIDFESRGDVPYARIRSLSGKTIYQKPGTRVPESNVVDVWGVEDPNTVEPREGAKVGIGEADQYVPEPFRQPIRDWLSGKIDQAEAERQIRATPVAPKPSKLSATPTVAPEAAAAPAVPADSDVPKGYKKVEKPRETALKVAFRPLESTPEGAAKAAEMDAKRDRVADALNKVLSPIVAKDVRLNLVSYVKEEETFARGAVSPDGKIISLSLDIYDPALTEDQLIDKLMGEMNHEIIHTLTDTGLLNPAEIKTLFDAADNTKYQGKSFTYFDRAYATYAPIETYQTQNEAGDTIPDMDKITEEAVAEMFRDYRAGKLKLNDKPKGIINKIIQFFKRMFRGFRDAEVGKVFTRIESGEVGARERGAAPAGAAAKLSAVPADMRRILEPSFKQFQAGEITREEWNDRVNTLKPVRPYPSVPEAPSLDQVRDAIGAKGEAKGVDRIGLAHRILKTGDRVKSRLDIPAYENKGVWVETIRSDDGKFEGASYDRAGMFTNVKFDVKERPAELVAAGENAKSPFAVIEGDWVDMTPEQIQARAEQVFNDPEWRQVGMDPTRHSYFYDRNTMEPVVSAEEVIQIGPLVLAKNAKTAPASGFKFSVAPAVGTDEFKAWFDRSKVLDKQGKPLVVHHFGSFNEDEDIPRSGMHFGTRQAAIDRAAGKRVEDAAMGVDVYQADDGLWHFDLDGVTSEDLGFVGFFDEENALANGRSEAIKQAEQDSYYGEPEDSGIMTSAYLSLQNPKRMVDQGGAEGEWDAAIAQAKAEGHDGIVYRNQYEDKGSDSYIAFEPTQIKSTKNIGTFSKEDKRIKFSVAPAVGSDEFNRWFKQSKAVNEDGSPMVYYRGDPKPLRGNELKTRRGERTMSGGIPGEEGPFFFSPRSRFAEDYALADHSKGGYGVKSKRGTMYPVYLSVQNPFDYRNEDHVDAVAKSYADKMVRKQFVWGMEFKEEDYNTYKKLDPQDYDRVIKHHAGMAQPIIKGGVWTGIEDPDIQRSIRELGFDGFYVVENGVRNLAVYKPEQVKSIFNPFELGTATSKKLSVAPSAYENVPLLEKPVAVQKQILGDVERMRRKANDIAKDVARKSDTTLDNSANAANIEVRNAVRKLSAIPQPQPQSAFFEAANSKLFAKKATPTSVGERLMDLLGGLGSSAGRTKFMEAFRVNYVQAAGQIAKYMRQLQIDGKIESGMAQYDAIASIEAAERASHQIPSMIMFGAGEVKTINGDPNSMHFTIEDNNGDDTPAKFFAIVETGGPNGASLMEQFKTLLIARAVVKRQGEGKDTPIEVTPQYIQNAEALAVQYPALEEAYGRYQRFNRKLIKAAMDAGVISQETFEAYTDDMNYYSMYREVGGEVLAPQPYGSTGKAVKIKTFKGSEQGNLIADPMVAMIRNMSFWTGATMRNIAAQKAHRVAMEAGIGRDLLWQGSKLGWQSPDPARKEDERFMSYLVDGTEVRYAVTDSLFAVGLANTESSNLSFAMELMGLPTTALREMVTRDPGFMIANLLRDSISTWILAGSGASPAGTLIGLKKALMNDASYQNLKRMGVVGSYDEAQKSPKQMVAGMRANITGAQGLTNATDALKWGWDRLGKLSDASDAATRIAVYEAAIKDGADEYTAAYRALSIMNFSRRGASAGLSVATRLIPFLNARIQGFDVLYTGMKSAVQLTSGAQQTAFEKQRGAAVWYRGLGLMAGALALAMLNEDDEDYKQIPQYIRDANFLIPVGGSKFISIPKPFEAGLIFGTVPTTMYEMMRGTRSTRSGIKLFTSQLSSTFGFNPMPQVALPIFENLMNADFYTGQPLISPGAQKLDPSLQYSASTSYVARGLGKLLAYSPFGYDYESGKFEGVSPIMIDNLITGYGGPIAGYVTMGIGGLIGAFGEDNEGIPIAGSNLPVIRRFFVDAQDKQPQAAAEAYELYQLVDKATRTVSRLKKMGDVAALKEFREENIDLLRVGKQVRKMAENLNNIRAQVRRLEVNTTMSGSEKKEKMRELRARELQVSRKVEEINAKLGR